MSQAKPNQRAMALTDVILDLFRVNGLLLSQGDRLVENLGLTSARWQVLGAIAYAPHPEPVAWLARDLGSNRQNIQRIVNDLQRDGFVAFQPNPHHRRAQLVALTEKGKKAFDQATRLWLPWADSLAEGHPMKEIEAMGAFIKVLRRKLESARGADED